MSEQAIQLAEVFSAILNDWLSPEEIAEINVRNDREESDSFCHTHDYCDSNMAMLEAFGKVTGRSYCFYNSQEPGSFQQNVQDDLLWLEAWNMARKQKFALRAGKEAISA